MLQLVEVVADKIENLTLSFPFVQTDDNIDESFAMVLRTVCKCKFLRELTVTHLRLSSNQQSQVVSSVGQKIVILMI